MAGVHPQLVAEQVNLYAKQVEHWKKDGIPAALCWEIEQLLRLGFTALDNIRSTDRHWSIEARQKNTVSAADVRRIGDLYRRWLKACERLLPVIDRLEAEQFFPEGADRLRRSVREVRLTVSIDPARIPTDIDAKHSVTLSEMRNALHAQA